MAMDSRGQIGEEIDYEALNSEPPRHPRGQIVASVVVGNEPRWLSPVL